MTLKNLTTDRAVVLKHAGGTEPYPAILRKHLLNPTLQVLRKAFTEPYPEIQNISVSKLEPKEGVP